MENTNNFIKFFDEQIAIALHEGGFSYIQEKINDGQIVYCFEETPKLLEAIRGLSSASNFQDFVIVRDHALLF